ncbi:MAG TPA: tetratricopeptide repeat protein [Dehalococcoidia bacterium]|nr:tetratricopeptide repeat protein [Dehalococcoidia bacterium]
MTQGRTEATERHRRQLANEAVSLALASQWERAVAVNRELLEQFPNDVEALNRLGKALMELGRLAEARDTYQRAADLDRSNTIARRNLERLAQAANVETTRTPRAHLAPDLFLEETGKTGITRLTQPAQPDVLAKVAPGDPVLLIVEGRSLLVKSSQEEYLGEVEPRLTLRLLSLMEGGNRYAAAVTSVDKGSITVIIKETYQHPDHAGKLSFPTRTHEAYRSYIRGSLLRYGDVEERATAEPEWEREWPEEAEEEREEEGTEARMTRRERLIEEEDDDDEEEEE